MIVVIMVAKANGGKSNSSSFCSNYNSGNGKVTKKRSICEKIIVFRFCSDCNNSNGKVSERRTISEKLVGNGPVMDNYVGCDSSCNSYNIG